MDVAATDSRTRHSVALNPTAAGLRSAVLSQLAICNVLLVLATHSCKIYLLSADVGVFWLLLRVLGCGATGLVCWTAVSGQLRKKRAVEWSVLGMSSLLMFLKQAGLLTALYRLPSTRVILITHFSAVWLKTLLTPTSFFTSCAVVFALAISFLSDAAFFGENLRELLLAYGALVLEAIASAALDHTQNVLTSSLGEPMTHVMSTLGAFIFSVPLYMLRHVMAEEAFRPSVTIGSLAYIPLLAYVLLFQAPKATRIVKSPSTPSQFLVYSYLMTAFSSMFIGRVIFGRAIVLADFPVAALLMYALYPRLTAASAPTPYAATSRIVKAYLKSILSNPESRKIFYFLMLNMCYMLVQMLYGVWTNSLGLISDAIHMAFDCMAIGVGLIASVMARWPPNERFTYGYGRIETLSGFANGIFLILISLFIVFEAIQRLLDPPEMNTSQLLLVSSLGLGVNLFASPLALSSGGTLHSDLHSHTTDPIININGIDLQIASDRPSHSHHHSHTHSPSSTPNDHSQDLLVAIPHGLQAMDSPLTPSYKFGHDVHFETHHASAHTPNLHDHSHVHDHAHEGHSHNMRGVFLHVMADTLGSVGVIVSTLLIQWYGWTGFDPIASLFIAILIAASVIPLVIDTGKVLALDISDRETKIQKILSELSSIEGLASYTSPRFWPKDDSSIIGSIHIQLDVSPSSYDPTGPHSSKRTVFANVDRVVERVDKMLRNKIPGLEELTIQVEGSTTRS
ncbi:uncharacterized protein FIBRA_02411 [Fibroporia radiculosa]|uniref:Cation efflux protein transmembrane domain-containing protein n=1 Tax=Fibroporia radiculosa TaxID=599839 RepID=J4I917_9APHY|nr:uncharacterized protein FIBRA_02411 [Fibroporia radiculosa]CCM00381.1 predicted protein [Fibroporia radiculosa]